MNSVGEPEVPRIVFEELLVNALIHRDYFISAPVKLLIFDNRIEIISPGHLPNHLTLEQIRIGNSNLRNPILASYVAKKILPYRGLGSGIPRAPEDWPNIEFTDDREKCLFTATIFRNDTEQATGQVSEAETGAAGQVAGEATEQATEQELKLIMTLKEKTMTLQELMAAMDLKHRPSFLYTYLQPSLEAGYIEMTEPDKPKSPNQKYRLTAKGLEALKKL